MTKEVKSSNSIKLEVFVFLSINEELKSDPVSQRSRLHTTEVVWCTKCAGELTGKSFSFSLVSLQTELNLPKFTFAQSAKYADI